MSEQIILLSGLLDLKGDIVTVQPPKIVKPRREMQPVTEADHKNLMANWKPVMVAPKPSKPKYIPLHRSPQVKIPNLISRSPIQEKGILIID